LSNWTYQPSPVRRVEIPKPGAGKAYKCRFLKKCDETVRCGKLMSVINIHLPEVPPCLAIQNYTNG
jgi:hypothetical protein